MDQDIRDRAERYADAHADEAADLLRRLGPIPAPSHDEGRRAEFCRDWLVSKGAAHVRIDEVNNVICEIGRAGATLRPDEGDLVVLAAHTDVVQPDVEPYPLREEAGRLYAPGIGDDTANLVCLLMGAAWLLQSRTDLGHGILVVCNSCEEGLGNLDGTKALFSAYEGRIAAFHSFDLNAPLVCCTAVGSHRYRVTCTTKGGHSYADFGRANAIEVLCGLVEDLYALETPSGGHTTFNVGRIEGGTTVNSIAQRATMLYEYRSTSQRCLEQMRRAFLRLVETHRGPDRTLLVEEIGVRPGGVGLNPDAQEALRLRCMDVMESVTGEQPSQAPASTDANIPLSQGIPACTMGVVRGGMAHTREEWVELGSLPQGMALVIMLMLTYAAEA